MNKENSFSNVDLNKLACPYCKSINTTVVDNEYCKFNCNDNTCKINLVHRCMHCARGFYSYNDLEFKIVKHFAS